MSFLKDMVRGGLPAVLDMPEGGGTAYDSDTRPMATISPIRHQEQQEPAAPGSTSAGPGRRIAGMPQQTVFIAGGALLAGVLIAVLVSR